MNSQTNPASPPNFFVACWNTLGKNARNVILRVQNKKMQTFSTRAYQQGKHRKRPAHKRDKNTTNAKARHTSDTKTQKKYMKAQHTSGAKRQHRQTPSTQARQKGKKPKAQHTIWLKEKHHKRPEKSNKKQKPSI